MQPKREQANAYFKAFGASAATSIFNGLPFPKDMAETVPIVLNFGIQASDGARPVLWLSEPEAFSEDMSEDLGRAQAPD